MSNFTIGLVGNPNCGKTTLFNLLTGAKQQVGNWPGVTVGRKTGLYTHGGNEVEVVDTPGIYSLTASSLDEKVTRDYCLSGDADLIVNIVDAANIERNLYLTSQLLEMEVPMVIALNMMDIAQNKQMDIDLQALAQKIGCPVIPVVAAKNQGVDELKETINNTVTRPTKTATITYPPEINEAILQLIPLVRDIAHKKHWHPDWVAIKLLENDAQVMEAVPENIIDTTRKLQEVIAEKSEDDPDILISSARYNFINQITKDTVHKRGQVKVSMSNRIDKIVLNRILDIPIFLAIMYLMFMFTINLGGAFIDFFGQFTGAIFVDGLGRMLTSMGTPVWLKVILADGVGGGIQTMATFIPIIGFMFFFLSFLEDSGYMARGAFIMDRFMQFIGLPGKSFIPMLVGFGCNVPAILATRTLENKRDRILTIMMNPFMSCGARLPVYVLFVAAFFPTDGQNLIFLLYLIGIAFAIFTGFILKNTLLKGGAAPYIMELPPYQRPSLKAVFLRTYDRLKTFIFNAGQILIPVIVTLSFLNSLGTDGSFGNENRENSVLSSISKAITPALHPMGITDQNWPATVGVFTGIFAKEAIIGTLNSLYTNMDSTGMVETGEQKKTEETNLWQKIKASFATIPANLVDLTGVLTDPQGLSSGNIKDRETVAKEMEVDTTTFGSMVAMFGSKAAAFAYLLFILLYAPCAATIATIYQETNLKWAIFATCWTTFMAYFAATIFYQTATMANHPLSSTLWIIGNILALLVIIITMKIISKKQTSPTIAASAA